jgi:NAD+ synthase
MDRCLYGVDRGMSPEALARAAGLAVEQVREIYRQIALRRRATRYLHMPPSLCEEPPVDGRSAARVALVGADRISDVGVH